MQSSPVRITSSATKIRSLAKYREDCTTRKQTPEGRVFVCCDAHSHAGCGHGGRTKHGEVKDFWRGEKLRKYSK